MFKRSIVLLERTFKLKGTHIYTFLYGYKIFSLDGHTVRRVGFVQCYKIYIMYHKCCFGEGIINVISRKVLVVLRRKVLSFTKVQ